MGNTAHFEQIDETCDSIVSGESKLMRITYYTLTVILTTLERPSSYALYRNTYTQHRKSIGSCLYLQQHIVIQRTMHTLQLVMNAYRGGGSAFRNEMS